MMTLGAFSELREKPEAVERSTVWGSSLTSFVDDCDDNGRQSSFNVGVIRQSARGVFLAAAVLAVAFCGIAALTTVATKNAVQAEFHRQEDLEIEKFKILVVGRISEDLQHVHRLAVAPPSAHSCDFFNEWGGADPDTLRVRSINMSGWETIRAEVSDDFMNSPSPPASVSCGGLQDKSGRGYTNMSLELPASSVYLSEIDLNVEHGKVEEPYSPVYRISAPTFATVGNETIRTGFLVVNMNAMHIWQQISESLVIEARSAKLSWDVLNTDMHYLASSRLDQSILYGHVLPGRSHMAYNGPLRSQIHESLRCASAGCPALAPPSVRSGASVAVVVPYGMFAGNTRRLNLQGKGGLVLVLSHNEAEVWREAVAQLTTFFILLPYAYIAVLAAGGMAWAWFQEIKRREEKNKESHKFLAGMSHDLRSPLHVMSSCLQLLHSEELAQKYEFRALEAAVESMLSLLSNTVLIYRTSKDRHVPPQKTFLRRVVISLMEVTSFLANEKDINIELNIADDVPEALLVNWVGLKQVLSNLLSNGIKFTSRGGIRVSIEAEAEQVPGSGSTSLRISVADTGPGLPGSGRYVCGSSAKETSGGLGLAICSRITESMGATLHGASEPGSGSVFTISNLICPVIEAPKPHPIWKRMAAARPVSGYDIVAVVSDELDNPRVLPAIVAFVERLKSLSTVRLSVISGPELADNEAAITPGSIVFIGSHVVRDDKLLSAASKRLRETGSSAILLSFVCGSLSHANAMEYVTEEFPCSTYVYPPWMPERIAVRVDAQAQKAAAVDGSISSSTSSSLNDIFSTAPARQQKGTVSKAARSKASAVVAALNSSDDDGSSKIVRAPSIPSGLRVLVVDDMAVNRKIINRILLKRFNIKAIEASGGFDCLDRLREGRGFDLVLMDLHMPGMDGMESTKMLRQLEREMQLEPALVSGLSASVLDRDRVNCLECGMDAYYSKPISTEQLGTVLQKAGRRKSCPG